jgi:hypothetical protein
MKQVGTFGHRIDRRGEHRRDRPAQRGIRRNPAPGRTHRLRGL